MGTYIFAEHFLAVSSHTPPALSQLALSVALVTSPAPAKAGPVTASAKTNANAEMSAFMYISPLVAGVPKELRPTARVPRLQEIRAISSDSL
jgi:hypothetical protein